ncbi:hypothetical protein [Brevundimonas sp.]|uniref:hypothetical protein n=1 Tax=Brevundimonas sp. TaxID=1871086 RepID=UPI0028A642FE|nr:hypothetical protein [Brevundimonas sp.]
MRKIGVIDCTTLDGLLADPTTSSALKVVIKAWSGRDCLDAEHDARLLHAALVRDVDHRLGLAP